MSEKEPNCALVLAQVEDSLLAMKRHITTYRLQLLLLSIGKKGKFTYLPPVDAKKSRADEASLRNDPSAARDRGRAQ
jgi:hypothetical protein